MALMLASCFGGDFSVRSIGGTVSGPVAGGVVLQIQLSSGTESLLLEENKQFVFSKQGVVGKSYEVTVQKHPQGAICLVSNGSGVVRSGGVDDVSVNCSLFQLDARPDFGQITLDWAFASPVDIRYSTDPYCDWDSYSICPDGEMLVNAYSGLTLDASEGLAPGEGYYFVMDADGMRSEVVAASPWPASVNGDVSSVLVHDERWYVGGDFTEAAPRTGAGALLDVHDGRLRGVLQAVERENSVSDLPAQVRAVISDGRGGWFIGGRFQSIGGVLRDSLARIRSDGTLDTDWSAGSMRGGPVTSLAYANGTLYVGGNFTRLGGDTREGFAAVDAETGELLAWRPLSGGYNLVDSLLAVDGVVYAGGFFIDDIWSPKWGDRFIAIDAQSGDLIEWPSSYGANDRVTALAYLDGVIYAGGVFTRFLGQDRERLAAFDAASGALLDWNPGADNWVKAFAFDDNTLYVGGFFEQIAGETRRCIVAFDIASGELTAWDPGANGHVEALEIVDSRLYAGGGFTEIGGQQRNSLAAFDAEGSLLGWAPETDGRIMALAATGSRLYAGGSFMYTNLRSRDYLAAFDAVTGQLSDWSPEVKHPVDAIAIGDSQVFVASSFDDGEGEVQAQLAAFDADSGYETYAWNALDLSGGMIHALQVAGNNVYVGGTFSHAGHYPRQGLAAFDAFSGNLLAWGPTVTNSVSDADIGVYALARAAGKLYIGGNFLRVDGELRTRLASFDLETGRMDNWAPSANGKIMAMTVGNGMLYIGGAASTWDDTKSRVMPAAFDIESGELSDWNSGGLKGAVLTLTHTQGWLYAGGEFTESRAFGETVCSGIFCEFIGEPRPHLAAFHEDTGELAEWNPVANDVVLSLASRGGVIYAGGLFTRIGGEVPPDGQSRGHLTTLEADTVPFVEN